MLKDFSWAFFLYLKDILLCSIFVSKTFYFEKYVYLTKYFLAAISKN
jgi:hypothetical protein